MKGLMMIVIYSVLLSLSMSYTRAKPEKVSKSTPIADSTSFQSQLKPILLKKCSPCHFEGGKMYEKMPFDKASTIIGHETGVLRRFNDENEKTLVKKFIHEHSSAK